MDEKYIDRSVNVFFNVFDDIGSNSRGGGELTKPIP